LDPLTRFKIIYLKLQQNDHILLHHKLFVPVGFRIYNKIFLLFLSFFLSFKFRTFSWYCTAKTF